MQVNGSTLVLVGDSCGGCGAGVGIFATSILGGPITKLVDTNDTSASFPGTDKHFGGFPPDFRIGDGTVVFQNRQQAFAVPLAGGKVTAVAGIQDQNVSPPAPYCCNFSEPSVKGTKGVPPRRERERPQRAADGQQVRGQDIVPLRGDERHASA